MTRFWTICLIWALSCSWALAQEANDGFTNAQSIPGEHFTVDYKSGVDLQSLTESLKISPADQHLTGIRIDNSSNERKIASMIEILFNRTGDILDMHVYSLTGHIKVFENNQQLNDFYKSLYNRELPGTGLSYYLADYNSIYVSAENFTRNILGHEMGHAIQSKYFVVQPSTKIQEVLAGYVEYQLKKSKE